MRSLHIALSPLDWGLGHASRCVPLIHFFLSQGHKVSILCGAKSRSFLENECSGVTYVDFPELEIRIPQKRAALSFIAQSLKIKSSIERDKKALDHWLTENTCDLIISDNRYGIFHKDIPSVIITHQVHLKAPFGWNKIPQRRVIKELKKFDEVWIADDPTLNLAGDLSKPLKGLTQRYIGVLSRFQKNVSPFVKMEYDWMALISGPETQRTVFQNEIFSLFKKSKLKTLIVCGLPDGAFEYTDENTTVVSHLSTEDLRDAISKSNDLICRSGYSTLMDLCALKKSAILVATPGQSEQEYLADYLSKKGLFKSITQSEIHDFNLMETNEDIGEVNIDSKYFEQEITDFLNKKFATDG